MTLAVLDASALLALLQAKPGQERVRAVLVDAAMSAVNLGEVVGHPLATAARRGIIRNILEPLPFEMVPFGGDLAYTAGLLLPATQPAGLSFGDRACLALARQLGGRSLTADRAWSSVAPSIGVEVELIR